MDQHKKTTQPATAGNPARHGLSEILRDVGTALFHWSSADDRIRWSANAADIFSSVGLELPKYGKDYEAFLEDDTRKKRQRVVIGAAKAMSASDSCFEHSFTVRDVGIDGRQRVICLAERGRLLRNADGTIHGIHGSVRLVRNNKGVTAETVATDLDQLTGALSRSAMTAQINASISSARTKGGSCAVLVVAIDKLAVVNDAFGFDIADTVIAEISHRIAALLREGDMIGRIAGNKFALLLHNCNLEEAKVAAQRIQDGVANSPVEIEGTEVVVTVSIGGVLTPRFAADAERALCRAIEALDDARRGRRSGLKIYESNMQRDVQRRDNLRLATDLLSALSEGRMGVALQPVVSTVDDEPAFYEALVRVRSRDGEDVTAGAFMGLAEKLGLIHLIDTRMLDLVVEMLKADPSLKVSLNVSVSTALDPDWFQRITDHILHQRDIAARLIVEITETEAIQDIQETAAVVSWMHDLGCKVALDDFGAGYTTYRNLRDLGVDLVKIDGAFMLNLHRSKADQMFVKTLINLASNLGIETVAEWVEDERDANLLKKWGAEYIQGHFYGRAITRYMPCDGPLDVKTLMAI